MKPVFEHDCESCTFLGHFYAHDVYMCSERSIVARRSSEPGEYSSMPKASFVRSLENDSWAEDKAMRAMVAGMSCHAAGDLPPSQRKFESIAEIGGAVDRLKWDMLFGTTKQDIVPDPNWGLEATTAFNHFYIARSLLEQAGHHLTIAAAYDRDCWRKFQEKQEAT
jgi:hypothetical protein